MIDKIREQQLEQLSSQLKNELKNALLSFMTKNKPNKDNIELYHKLDELLNINQIHNVTCYIEHLFMYLSVKYHFVVRDIANNIITKYAIRLLKEENLSIYRIIRCRLNRMPTYMKILEFLELDGKKFIQDNIYMTYGELLTICNNIKKES